MLQTSGRNEPSITVIKQLISTGTATEPAVEEESGSKNIVKQWKRSTHQQKQLAKKVHVMANHSNISKFAARSFYNYLKKKSA